MASRGPAPGASGKRPAFSSALRTASSSAALLSTSAWASGSSETSSCRGNSAYSGSCARAAAPASTMAKIRLRKRSLPRLFPNRAAIAVSKNSTAERADKILAHRVGGCRAAFVHLLKRAAFARRVRLLALGERHAVSGADDVRPVLLVVELRRVGRLVAAHAHGLAHLAADVLGGIGHMLAPRSVAGLALDIAPAEPVSGETGAAHFALVDAADAAGLLPSRDVAADAVEAELLLHRDQRVVGVRVPGLLPEFRGGLVTLHAAVHPDEELLALGGRRAGGRLGLRFGEVQLGHFFVVGVDQLLCL